MKKSKQFQSIDKLSDEGKIKVSCGHVIDIRSVVYVHYADRTELKCQKCTEELEPYASG